MAARCGWRRGRVMLIPTALVLSITAACDYTVGPDSGDLDPTFGDGGAVTVDGLRIRTSETATSTDRLDDGRLVAVGTAPGVPWAVTRQRADGTLDPTFGNGGVAPVGLEPMGDIAATPSGGVLVPGRWHQSVWGLAHLRPDGTPDPDFGTDGVAVLDVAGASGQNWTLGVAAAGDTAYLLGWVRQADGTIDTIVLAIAPDGSLDPTFGPEGTGVVRIPRGGSTGAIAVRTDGTIVVAHASIDSAPAVASGVVALTPAGAVLARLDLSSLQTTTPIREVDDLDVGADGSLALLVNDSYGTPTSYVVRVTSDLALDPAFTTGAASRTGVPVRADGHQVVLDDDTGRVVLTGQQPSTGATVSLGLTPTGEVDTGYGDGGTATHVPYTTPTTVDGLFTREGGLLIAGDTARSPDDPPDLYQLALTGDGAPDADVGDGGWTRADVGADANERFSAVAPVPGGDVIVAAESDGGVVVGRYDRDGTPDATHPPAPLLPDRLRNAQRVVDIAVDGSGAALLLVQHGRQWLEPFYGGGPFGWSIVRLRPDGSLDTAFGDGGLAPAGTPSGAPRAIGVRTDGTILVADVEVTPAQPPRPGSPGGPATFVDGVVSLTPAGVRIQRVALATTYDTPTTTPYGALDIAPGGDAYAVANGRLYRIGVGTTVSGPAVLPSGTTASLADVAVDGSGRVVATGVGTAGGAGAEIVARFDAALGVDPTFGSGGVVARPAESGSLADGVRSIHASPDGTVTRVHFPMLDASTVLIHRFTATGAADASLSDDGVARGPIRVGGAALVPIVSAVSDEDVLVAGTSGEAALAVRVNG